MTTAVFFAFLTSLSICMAMIPPLQAYAGRWRFMDHPGERKVHARPIPRIGGMAFGCAALLAIVFWAPHEPVITPVLLSACVILGFGIWDDRVALNYKMKLVGQVAAVAVVMTVGQVRLTQIPWLYQEDVPLWISVPVTALFLIGAANAVNLSDGLDGLAGGLAFLSFSGMAYLAYLSHETAVLVVVAGFLGGLLGFLRYNTYPARIFMGDAGSQLLGFSMGLIVLLLSDEGRAPFSPATGIMLLGLPFLDTMAVMLQRIVKGRSPFVGDRNHVHHKLLALGCSHYEAVIVIYAIQAAMVASAYLLRWQSDGVVIAVYGAFAAGMVALFVAAERRTNRVSLSDAGRLFSETKFAEIGRWLSDMAPRLLAVVVPGFLIVNVFLPGHVPLDIGYAAWSLFAVIGLGLWWLPRYRSHFVRGGLYVGSTFLMYIGERDNLSLIGPIAVTQNTILAIIALLVLVCMRFGRGDRFQTTPLDYLMAFFALIVPMLPEMRADMPTLSILTAKLIVLYFAFELLLHTFGNQMKRFGLVSLWILFGVGVRAWL